MAKVSRIKMKNGKHYLFNGLTRVRSNFSYTLLICLFNPIVFLHCTFHFRLFFLFLFHSFHSYQSHYWYFLQTCSFLAFHSPRISHFLLFFPFSYSSFPLSTFIYIFFHQAQSHPLIVHFSSYHLSIYFLNFCYLFPLGIMNSLVVCSIQPSPPPPRSIPFTLPKIFQFRIAARNPSSIENVCPAHPNRIYDLGLLKNGTDRGRDYQVTRTACYSSFIKPPPVAQ